MPIRGLTTNARATQVRIGKIRKGEPKTSATRPGEDIDGAFRMTAEDDDPEIQAAFDAAYGQRPEHFDAFLATPKLDDAWECWQEEWNASSLQHRCDGVKCVTWQDDHEYHHVNWDDAQQAYINDLGQVVPLDKIPDCPGGCKAVGRLQLLLPEMIAQGYVGPATLETHSKHDIMSITGALNDLQAKANGNLGGILLRVYRVTQEITATYADKRTGEVKRRKVAKSLVKIRPSVEWVQAQLQGAQQRALLALAGPADDDADSTMLIEGEFEEIEEIGSDDTVDDPFADESNAHTIPAAWLKDFPKYDEAQLTTRAINFLGAFGLTSLEEAAEKMGLARFEDFDGTVNNFMDAIKEASA